MAFEFGNQSKSYLSKALSNSLNDFKAFAYEAIDIDSTVKRLTVPDGARYAQLTIESDNTTAVVARFLRNTSIVVSTTVGLGLYNGTILDITDYANLNGFQITEGAIATTTLRVEYFK